jgi:hypothetical protein
MKDTHRPLSPLQELVLVEVNGNAKAIGSDKPDISAAIDQSAAEFREKLEGLGVDLDDPQVLFGVIIAGLEVAKAMHKGFGWCPDPAITEATQIVTLSRLGSERIGQ